MSVSRHTLATMIEKEMSSWSILYFCLKIIDLHAWLVGSHLKTDRRLYIRHFLCLQRFLSCSSFLFFLYFKDILENESINLDWMFRYSLINDIVKVRRCQTGSTGIDLKSHTCFWKIVPFSLCWKKRLCALWRCTQKMSGLPWFLMGSFSESRRREGERNVQKNVFLAQCTKLE